MSAMNVVWVSKVIICSIHKFGAGECILHQFHVEAVLQAAAAQRSGRAGRSGPGHCYRLYSSAVFESFAPHPLPEICAAPIDAIVLQLKSLRVPSVAAFPFPTPPPPQALASALVTLKTLGAIEGGDTGGQAADEGSCSALGHAMAALPLAPRY